MNTSSAQVQQLLEQMHDIRAPEPVGWWPLAPGWWLLIALVVLAAATLCYSLLKRRRANRYRHEALALLDAISSDPDRHSVADINNVLKRTALYAYPDDKAVIVPAHGRVWVQWLNGCCTQPLIVDQAAETLIWGAYQGGNAPPLNALLTAARQWVRNHQKARRAQGSGHA